MNRLTQIWNNLISLVSRRQAKRGQGLVEYALILVLVAVVVIAALLLLGPTVKQVYSNVVCSLDLSSDISHVTAQKGSSSVILEVSVRRSTTITISGSVSGGGACNPPSCTYGFSGLSEHGNLTVKATQGMCTSTYKW